MENETEESYKKEIRAYINNIKVSFYDAMERCLNHTYSDDTEYVDFEISPEFFTDEFSVCAMIISNKGIWGDVEQDDLFNNVKPVLRKELDPFYTDFDHREEIFMDRIQYLLSVVGEWEKNPRL